MIINKKRFSQIRIQKDSHKKRDSHRWSQIKICAYKETLNRWVDRGTNHWYSVWGYQDNFKPVFFMKRFWAYKKHQNPKQMISTLLERFLPSSTVLCVQKTVAFVVFCLLIFVFVGWCWLICVFVRSKSFRKKKNNSAWNCIDSLIYYTTNNDPF